MFNYRVEIFCNNSSVGLEADLQSYLNKHEPIDIVSISYATEHAGYTTCHRALLVYRIERKNK